MIRSIGKSGARSSGPIGWPVPGCSGGCGGDGRVGEDVVPGARDVALGKQDLGVGHGGLLRAELSAPPVGGRPILPEAGARRELATAEDHALAAEANAMPSRNGARPPQVRGPRDRASSGRGGYGVYCAYPCCLR